MGEVAQDPGGQVAVFEVAEAKGWPVQLATKVIGGQTATQRLISHIYTGFDEGHFPEGTYHVTWSGTAALHFGGDASGETNRTSNSVDFKVNDARTGITMFVDGFNQANPVKDIHIWLPDWTDPDDPTKTYHFGTTSFQPPGGRLPGRNDRQPLTVSPAVSQARAAVLQSPLHGVGRHQPLAANLMVGTAPVGRGHAGVRQERLGQKGRRVRVLGRAG